MDHDRLSRIEKEIAQLRAEIADVRNAFKLECEDTTDHIRFINANIKKINLHLVTAGNHLTRLLFKVMPEYASTRLQVDAIVERGSRPGESDNAP
jgi:hypothetical protein